MTANERDLGVDVVYGCFSEEGDSKRLLLVASASKAARQLTSFSD